MQGGSQPVVGEHLVIIDTYVQGDGHRYRVEINGCVCPHALAAVGCWAHHRAREQGVGCERCRRECRAQPDDGVQARVWPQPCGEP